MNGREPDPPAGHRPPRPVGVDPELASRFGHRLVRLASNENPLGASPRAQREIRRAAETHRYPDPSGRELRRALGRHHDWPPEGIVLGAGASEIIELLVRACLPPGGSAVISEHAFLPYRAAVEGAGRRAVPVPMRDRRHDLEAMAAACGDRTGLLFVANPNNPTGTHNSAAETLALLRRLPPGCLAVLDEAYREFVDAGDYPDGVGLLRGNRAVVVLRTFSKVYGLAGLRIGYAVADPEVIDRLERLRSPYNTSGVAQAAARAALEDEEFVRRSRASNRREREFLQRELRRRGIDAGRSQANFVFVPLPGRSAAGVARRLRAEGILVCPLEPYGLEGLRVTVGRREDHLRLLRALDRILTGTG